MKLVKLSLIFLSMFLLISVVSATTFVPTSLTIDAKCGDTEWVYATLTDVPASCSVVLERPLPSAQLDGLELAFRDTEMSEGDGAQMWILYAVNKNTCEDGQEDIIIDVCGTDYSLTVNVDKSLPPMNEGNTYYLREGKKFTISNGGDIDFHLLEVGSTSISYILEGCDDSNQIMNDDDILEATCGMENLRVEIDELIPDFGLAGFKIFFSNPSLVLSQSESDTSDINESTCILGIDTLGATVKRGSVFAFNTINTVTGKYEKSTIVNILDQAGDLTPLSGTSDNTGFFSKRIHEDYEQDLLIKLFKDGCEPTNKVILFEQSYDDYISAKADEEGGTNLVLNMSARYEMKAISGTIKNELNEVVEGVNVKITRPDSSIITVLSNTLGLFTFTPIIVGDYQIQGGKDDFKSTALVTIEVYQNKQYLIVIKVDGEQPTDATYRTGDRITIELRDENNTLVPMSLDATMGGVPLKFISGISDTFTFTDTTTLVIPAKDGYTAQSVSFPKKTSNVSGWIYWVLIGIGVIVALGIIGRIIKKRGVGGGGTPGQPKQTMQFQLSKGEQPQ